METVLWIIAALLFSILIAMVQTTSVIVSWLRSIDNYLENIYKK